MSALANVVDSTRRNTLFALTMPSPALAPSSEEKYCSGCRTDRPLAAFDRKKNGNPDGTLLLARCRNCEARRKKTAPVNVNRAANPSNEALANNDPEASTLPIVDLEDFLALLDDQKGTFTLEARVRTGEIIGDVGRGRKPIASALSRRIWTETNYRFK